MTNPLPDATPSASGILHCLRLLAQEAASLKLVHTLSAIEDALEVAVYESGMDTLEEPPVELPVPAVLH